jgi:alkanesulfonate monooxygenase SsuD/methylene tetrahydromethanopterin reductase-like flavin-dependent oxidoreductase (luciferase family)
MIADDLGYNIMVNEHHQTATCMASTVIVSLTILARQTKNARILVLGYPIGHRPDPLRCAEELSTIDVISRGRLDMGFIKGVPYEFPASNQNPVGVMDRFWEAHDFILKAMTSHDENFNWEGEYFHYRQVNIWPRPVQQPHPPVWSTTGSSSQARVLGEKGYVIATLGSGYATRPLYDAYRQAYLAKWKKPAPADRFAYLGWSRSPTTRPRRAAAASWSRIPALIGDRARAVPQSAGLPHRRRQRAHAARQSAPRSFTKDGRVINMHHGSVQDLIDAGILFCGTPDQVYAQIVDFTEYCGGMGNLLMMGHAGFLTHEDTMSNLELFSKHVMPKLKAYKQPVPEATAA